MAQISVLGGTGYAGSHLVREAVRRGHRVTAWSRHPPGEPVDGVDYRTGSLADPDVLDTAARAEHLVVAVPAADVDGAPLATRLPALTDAAIRHGARLSFVGGAGSSLVAEGGPRLIDVATGWPEAGVREALAHADVLAGLRAAPPELSWFYLSPAALFGSFAPGEATGAYRTDHDLLVSKPDGTSEISGADYALAYLDEIEHAAHPNQRFTVGH